MTRIGDRLLELGKVTPEQLDRALEAHDLHGGHLGQHLVLDGAISRLDLYTVLAEQWGTKVRDLVEEPPDLMLVEAMGLAEISDLGWVPCERTSGGTGSGSAGPGCPRWTSTRAISIANSGLPSAAA